MKKSFIYSLAAVFALAACTKEADVKVPTGETVTITASVDQTRSTEEHAVFSWARDESISVGTDDGEFVSFEVTDVDKGLFSHTFSGETPNLLVAVSPVQTNAVFIDATAYEVELPAVYNYYDPSKGVTNALMIGTPDPNVPNKFLFRHAAALVKVTYANVPVGTTSFVFEADENLTGTVTLEGVETSDIEISNSNSELDGSEVWINLSQPVAVPNTTLSFYVPVPTGDYSLLSIYLANAGGKIASTEKTMDRTGKTPLTLNRADVFTFPTITLNPAPEDKYYVKVTSTDDLADNGQYLIVYESGSVAFNGGLETLDATSNNIGVEITNNGILSSTQTDAASFTISVGSESSTIKSASGYYIGQTSNTNGLLQDETTGISNSISIDNSGNAVIVSGGAYLRYNKTSGQERFRYFKSSSYTSQQAVALYKLSAGAAPDNRTPVTLSFTPAEPEAITVGDEFTEPTLTVDPVEAASLVTYSVSTEPEGIASVDNNGELTITSAGTITVTASIADGNETYKPATASYTLTANPVIGHGESAEDPYTVAEALAIIDALETVGKDGRTETRYVSGIISQVISYNSEYHSITYNITADGQPSSAYIQVYSGKGLNGANFSSINDLSVGDEVIVAGSLMKYQSGSDIIPEIYQNSQIVSLVKAPYFTATASPQTFESEGGNATLSVKANVPWTATINNGGSLKIGDANASTAVSGTNDTEVTVIIPENAEGATYTISFTTTSDKVTAPDPIQITQNAYVDLVEATATFTGKKSGGMTGTQTKQTGVRRNVTAVISNGLADETSDHIRVYKNETLTLSVPDGAYITAIEFTGSSSSYPVSGFADQSGFTKSENSGIWSGSSQSVVFTASGSQVRLDRIDVTYRIAEEVLITYVPVINVTSANPMPVDNSAGSQTITYAIDEAPDGATLTGVTKNEGANWISNIVYSTSGTVTFDVAAQETGAQARSATLTLKYTGATDVPVTVNQAAGPSLGESTSTLTFTKACGGSGTADDGVSWTVTSDGSESQFDNTRGIHYGTNSANVQYIKLTTSDIPGTISKVVVNASTASGVTATVDVTVGGVSFGGDPKSLTTSATDYTFEGSASGEIVVTVTKPSEATKALYVKSIAVTYTKAQ